MKSFDERLCEIITPILNFDGFGPIVKTVWDRISPLFKGKMYFLFYNGGIYSFTSEFELGYNYCTCINKKEAKMYVFDSEAFSFERYEILWTYK